MSRVETMQIRDCEACSRNSIDGRLEAKELHDETRGREKGAFSTLGTNPKDP
jgi:hypothetical protein